MSDLNAIVTMITTVGFPIAMCLIFCWYINKQDLRHKEESDKFAEAINNNTLITQRLCDKLDEKGE